MSEHVVCIGRITKVEESPVRNGEPAHTLSYIEFGDKTYLFLDNGYGDLSSVRKLVMKTELLYGKTYEVVLREVKPDLAMVEKGRKFQEKV